MNFGRSNGDFNLGFVNCARILSLIVFTLVTVTTIASAGKALSFENPSSYSGLIKVSNPALSIFAFSI